MSESQLNRPTDDKLLSGLIVGDMFILLLGFMSAELAWPIGAGIAAFLTCQVSLMSVWIAVGGSRSVERQLLGGCFYSTAALLLGMAAAAAIETFADALAAFGLIGAIVFFCAIGLPRLLVRAIDLRLIRTTDDATESLAVRRPRPFQYTLRQLFSVSLVCSLLAFLAHRLAAILEGLLLLSAFLTAMATLGVGAAWVALSPGVIHRRAATLLAVVAIVGAAALWAIGRRDRQVMDEPLPYLWWLLLHVLMTIAVLLHYRRAGYRLVRGELIERPPAQTGASREPTSYPSN